MNGALPEDFAATARDYVAKLQAEPAKIASRKASQNALNAYGPHLPDYWAVLRILRRVT